MVRTKLIILDFDKVLFYRALTSKILNDMGGFQVKKYTYFPYPGVHDFLLDICRKYKIGFFTSITEKNAKEILETLLENTEVKYEFILDRRFVKLDPEYKSYRKLNEYDTIKLLSDVFNSPIVNHHRIYNKFNTIIIDDSYLKIRFNHPRNVILFDNVDMRSIIDKLGIDDVKEYNDDYNPNIKKINLNKRWDINEYTTLTSFSDILHHLELV